jgi:hypothetical protein
VGVLPWPVSACRVELSDLPGAASRGVRGVRRGSCSDLRWAYASPLPPESGRLVTAVELCVLAVLLLIFGYVVWAAVRFTDEELTQIKPKPTGIVFTDPAETWGVSEGWDDDKRWDAIAKGPW